MYFIKDIPDYGGIYDQNRFRRSRTVFYWLNLLYFGINLTEAHLLTLHSL